MDNKKLGLILVLLTILLAIAFFSFKFMAEENIRERIKLSPDGICIHENGPCPFEELNRLTLPTIIVTALLVLVLALGVYLMFFEKSQKAVLETLKETKQKQTAEERFDLLLSALDDDEKKVMKAVREQDGISQATLRIRIDMSKTKLSFVLKDLEKKNLIKKILKGKTNLVFLKKRI